MFGAPQTVAPLKLQVGMVDQHINETVTHVAELDEEAFRRQNRNILLFMLIPAIFGICFPCVWIMICIVYCCVRKQTEATIRGTQVYLTERTLVCTIGNQPIESSRVTIPLTNIASVMVQPGVMTVNIKPTAPEVMLNRRHATEDNATFTTTVATRTVPVYNIKNAEEFAKVIQSYLH